MEKIYSKILHFYLSRTKRSALSIFILLWSSLPALSQVYPVVVNTSLRPPYSLNLSDYANPSYDRIQTSLFMADLTKVNYAAKVRLVIRGAGGINISTLPGQEVGPIFLNGGQSVILTGAELNKLFDPSKLQFSGITFQQYKQNAALPEGIYQFHFEVLDYNVNAVVSNVNSGFATAWLVLNDPPIINQPENHSTIIPKEPQNVFFQWTPRHTGSPNSAFTTVYDLQLVEVYPANRNPNDAMLTSPPIFEKTISNTSYNYTVMDPYLWPGKWYAFRLRARDNSNRDLFKNQGYSEVYRFYYGKECPVPVNIKVEQLDPRSVIVFWENQPSHLSSQVQYKTESAKNWTSVSTFKNTAPISNLSPGEKYLFRVTGQCENNASKLTNEVPFVLPGTKPGCAPPSSYKTDLVSTDGKKNTVKITWASIPEVVQYKLYVESGGTTTPYTVENSSKTKSFSLFGRNTSLPTIYSKDIIVPVGSFNLTFEVICKDGSVTMGKKTAIDPTKGGVQASCDIPLTENVNATATSFSSADITWTAPKEFDKFVFKYRLLGAPLYYEVSTTTAKVSIIKLDVNKIYEYQIIYHCTTDKWIEGKSNTFKINIPPSLLTDNTSTGDCFPPSGITHEVTNPTTAEIKWAKDAEGKAYRIYYRIEGASAWDSVTSSTTNVTLEPLTINKDYEYQICVICKSGSLSIPSELKTFNTDAPYTYTGPCDLPILKSVSSIDEMDVKLNWEPREYYTGYTIDYRKNGSSSWVSIASQDVPKLLTNLSSATKYEYRVSAFCGTNKSDYTSIDTFTTRIPSPQFVCGSNQGYVTITNRIPIATLAAGDKFKAADFELTVKSLTSASPYNGEATVPIPYLKNSSFIFGLENVKINQDKQMYEGKVYFKKANLRLISEELANKIAGFADKLDKGLTQASTYMAMADSIQEAFNAAVQAASEPVDWKKYEGWTAQQLFAEGQRLVKAGEALIKQGTPSSIAQAKNMVLEGIQLIKAAAAMGGQVVNNILPEFKSLFQKVFGHKNDSLTAERQRLHEQSKLIKEINTYNGFSLPADPADEGDDGLTFTIDSVEVTETELKKDPAAVIVIETYKNEKSLWARLVVIEKGIDYLTAALNDPEKLSAFINTIASEIQGLDLTKLDQTLNINDLEKKINSIVTQKLGQL